MKWDHRNNLIAVYQQAAQIKPNWQVLVIPNHRISVFPSETYHKPYPQNHHLYTYQSTAVQQNAQTLHRNKPWWYPITPNDAYPPPTVQQQTHRLPISQRYPPRAAQIVRAVDCSIAWYRALWRMRWRRSTMLLLWRGRTILASLRDHWASVQRRGERGECLGGGMAFWWWVELGIV